MENMYLIESRSNCRYCFVQLKPESDIEEVKREISQIEFGTGRISVENKITRHEVAEVSIFIHGSIIDICGPTSSIIQSRIFVFILCMYNIGV